MLFSYSILYYLVEELDKRETVAKKLLEHANIVSPGIQTIFGQTFYRF